MFSKDERDRCLTIISADIISEVEALFDLAESKGDLCLQGGCFIHNDKDVVFRGIIFGGWNRVYAYANGVIRISRSHCCTQMLEVARILGYEVI